MWPRIYQKQVIGIQTLVRLICLPFDVVNRSVRLQRLTTNLAGCDAPCIENLLLQLWKLLAILQFVDCSTFI
ncbi:hypothetical protein CY652_07805 [Burkholderia sp. WAC0059]|nr:hypothetical protein CY652_07805 [Burkholderia sp. WAC0059]